MPYKDPQVQREKDREYKRRRRVRDGEFLRRYWREYKKLKPQAPRIRYPQRDRNYRLISKYGIDSVKWEQTFQEQGQRCAICGTDKPGSNGWQTDHCHDSGQFRGILCWLCNVGIGMLKHNARRLRSAADYVEAHAKRHKGT